LSTRHTRREFLRAAGAGTAWIALLGAPGCQQAGHTPKTTPSTTKGAPATSASPAQSRSVWTFRSRPDLSPPAVEVATQAHDTAPGYVFIAPKVGVGQDGPMIVDNLGRLVWFSKGRYARDFKVQRYRGEPVLTWWEGKIVQGHGVGEYVIFDDSYREIARVQAGKGYRADLHEFLITLQDIALLTIYNVVPMNLSRVGGPEDGAVWDGVAQELGIETGEVLFEWHTLEHVALEESYYAPAKDIGSPFDYFHINSIDVDYDDNLLISCRNTSTVYKVERETGEIVWRLGGKKSDFEMGPGTPFAYQHDARRQPDGTITIFDNGAPPRCTISPAG
jgi:Arylsulfotransferase (ASST)